MYVQEHNQFINGSRDYGYGNLREIDEANCIPTRTYDQLVRYWRCYVTDIEKKIKTKKGRALNYNLKGRRNGLPGKEWDWNDDDEDEYENKKVVANKKKAAPKRVQGNLGSSTSTTTRKSTPNTLRRSKRVQGFQATNKAAAKKSSVPKIPINLMRAQAAVAKKKTNKVAATRTTKIPINLMRAQAAANLGSSTSTTTRKSPPNTPRRSKRVQGNLGSSTSTTTRTSTPNNPRRSKRVLELGSCTSTTTRKNTPNTPRRSKRVQDNTPNTLRRSSRLFGNINLSSNLDKKNCGDDDDDTVTSKNGDNDGEYIPSDNENTAPPGDGEDNETPNMLPTKYARNTVTEEVPDTINTMSVVKHGVFNRIGSFLYSLAPMGVAALGIGGGSISSHEKAGTSKKRKLSMGDDNGKGAVAAAATTSTTTPTTPITKKRKDPPKQNERKDQDAKKPRTWTVGEILKLRKCIEQFGDDYRLAYSSFPTRSERSVAEKYRKENTAGMPMKRGIKKGSTRPIKHTHEAWCDAVVDWDLTYSTEGPKYMTQIDFLRSPASGTKFTGNKSEVSGFSYYYNLYLGCGKELGHFYNNPTDDNSNTEVPNRKRKRAKDAPKPKKKKKSNR